MSTESEHRPAISTVSVASRTDPRTGVRREISFLQLSGSGLFTCMHLPEGRPSAAVVICSPIGAEWMRNDRREARLADGLAARGLCAVRFHYRGTGHSDDPSEDFSVDTMGEDAEFIAERLVRAAGVDNLGFVGTRLGGMVAAAAASGTRARSIVLWEPVVNPRRYFREVVRARVMSDLGKGDSGAGASEALFGVLESTGSIDVLGYPITRALHDGALGRSIGSRFQGEPQRVLLVQFGGSRGLRSEYQDVVTEWRASGTTVETETLGTVEAWWFVRERWELERSEEWEATLIDRTASWFATAEDDAR